MPIKIVICDDHQVILDSLSLLLETIPDFEVIETFSEAHKALDFVGNKQPDVLISDLNMPGLNGVALTMALRKANSKTKILMLTVEENHTYIREAFNAGIDGYVTKKSGKDELEKAIATVASGEKYFSNAVLKELINPSANANEEEGEMPASLTAREIEIIKLLAKEFSTNDIAALLFLSPGTVKTHRHNIMKKLQVKNSIGIIKFAIRHKLL